jgi:hypothetical protein
VASNFISGQHFGKILTIQPWHLVVEAFVVTFITESLY